MKKSKQKDIALERINILFKEAEDIFHEDSKLADRYVKLAWKLALKYKVKFPNQLKKRFCKHCFSYLKQGVNCTVRITNGKAVYTCKNCNKHMRFPFTKEQKIKRKTK
ncbi:MAG: Ribonuclease P protein component 4 [Candidatus Woesearchaeota archaeon]|nr:Ribonuclease P protein component 4 [Candidatus Woesearchaeota archaeon]